MVNIDLEQMYHLVDLLKLDNKSCLKQKLKESTKEASILYNNELIQILNAQIHVEEVYNG